MIAPHDILRRGEEIENLIALNQLEQASKLLLSFVKDFDPAGKFKKDAIAISQRTSQFSAQDGQLSPTDRKQKRRELALSMINLIEAIQQSEA